MVDDTLPIKKTRTNKSGSDIHHNGRVITDGKEKAEVFYNFFASVAGGLIHDPDVPVQSAPMPPRLVKSMYMGEVSVMEVQEVVQGLKDTRSTGLDDVSVEVVKKCFTVIADILTHLINSCLNQGIFPKV